MPFFLLFRYLFLATFLYSILLHGWMEKLYEISCRSDQQTLHSFNVTKIEVTDGLFFKETFLNTRKKYKILFYTSVVFYSDLFLQHVHNHHYSIFVYLDSYNVV
jgi:hypothetical protein